MTIDAIVYPGSDEKPVQFPRGVYLGNSTHNVSVSDVGAVVINENGEPESDFRVETASEENMFLVDASADVVYVGGVTNGISVARGGHITLNGSATYFDDMLHSLIGQKMESPSSDVVQNVAEGTVDYKTSSALADYVMMNIQMSHKRKNGAALFPHLHWFQASATVPNWMIQYRYQSQGATKTTSWTSVEWESNAFAYVSGTINQITSFGDITPPSGDDVSDILQVRLIRDVSNASGIFDGADALNATVSALSFDVHVECDRLGSNMEYS